MVRLLSVLILATLASNFDELFADGRKELRIKQVIQDRNMKLDRVEKSNAVDPSRVIQLSWRPRAFLYKNFLTEEECDHLMALVHSKNSNSAGSSGAEKLASNLDFYLDTDDEIVARVEERISAWTFLPKVNSMPLKVTHFGVEDTKQKYNYFNKNSTELQIAPLVATVILYLSNVSAGGQIIFPESGSNIWSSSNCMTSSHTIRPTKGNALLFFAVNLNATPDHSSSHARCAVLEGDMWSATKFLYLKAINREKDAITSPDCMDEDDNCPRWAASGECQRNPVFMVGSPDYYGTCRKSCNVC
nr:probable prolyl 4-hydroxylase 12 isoform X1 [Ipomoea trifida]GMC98528.1 probable prolyl 4-hydroxylase 12 isoform X1 [Ipomoea batatas]